MDGLAVALARMRAEAEGTPLASPRPILPRAGPIWSRPKSATIRRASRICKATLGVLDEQQRQKALEVQELQAKQRAVQTSLTLIHQKLAMSDSLLKEGLVSKMENNDLQNTAQDLEGQVDILKSSIPKAQSAAAEAAQRGNEEKIKFVRAAQADVADTELTLARDRELMNSGFRPAAALDHHLADRRDRQEPARRTPIGGVVRPGEDIMEIVPLHDRLQIEAKLPPEDRGYVKVGQPAEVKVTAYDYTRYGGLRGTVAMVAPDTTITSNGQAYYRVIIETDSRAWDANGTLPITPGMVAMVDIHTGRRSVLRYLVTPVLKLRAEAFRER